MENVTPIEQDWPFLLTLFPADLAASARATGALIRKRGVDSASTLLRLAFAYAYCGLSLRGTVAWAREAQVAQLSEVALLKRLRHAADWFGHLLAQKLAQRALVRWEDLPPRLRLCLVDATGVSRPGSKGTDFRLHLKFDLGQLAIERVALTGVDGGESFKRCAVEPGDIAVGDRGYGHRQGIAQVVAQGGDVIVRLAWQNLPLQWPDGTPLDLLATVGGVKPTESGEWKVQTAPAPDGTPAVAGRLVVLRKSPEAAEAARRKLRAQARKKGKTPSAQTLEAAGYLFVLTTLPPERLSGPQVLEVYRFRWQIELAFKRMKGCLELDELAAKEEGLCRAFLCVKLLGALLVEELSHRWVDFSPWGYGPPAAGVDRRAVSGDRGDGAAGGGSGAHDRPLGSGERPPAAGVPRDAPPPFQPSCRSPSLYSSPCNR
jgi:IS4 transposase